MHPGSTPFDGRAAEEVLADKARPDQVLLGAGVGGTAVAELAKAFEVCSGDAGVTRPVFDGSIECPAGRARVITLDYDPDDPDLPGTELTPEAALADYIAHARGVEGRRTYPDLSWARHDGRTATQAVLVGTRTDDAEIAALTFEQAGTRGFWSLSHPPRCPGARRPGRRSTGSSTAAATCSPRSAPSA